MSQCEPTRQSDEILPPMGGVALAVTTAPVVVDLTTMSQTAALPQSTVKGSEHTNPLGGYITIVADGGDVYLNFAATAAALSAMSTTAVSTVTANAIVGGTTTNFTQKIPSGTSAQYRLPPGSASPARFAGFVTASGTATARINISSR